MHQCEKSDILQETDGESFFGIAAALDQRELLARRRTQRGLAPELLEQDLGNRRITEGFPDGETEGQIPDLPPAQHEDGTTYRRNRLLRRKEGRVHRAQHFARERGIGGDELCYFIKVKVVFGYSLYDSKARLWRGRDIRRLEPFERVCSILSSHEPISCSSGPGWRTVSCQGVTLMLRL